MEIVKKAIESEGFVSIVDGVLSGMPAVGGFASNAFSSWVGKNRAVAREVLLTNIRQGDVESVHTDEFFSMLSRFSRSVQEGVAKNNLILLAKLISGIGSVDKEKGRAETFTQYADMLESLTDEEIEFLAKYIKGKSETRHNKYEEMRQNLQQKGFFVSTLKPSISNKEKSKDDFLTRYGITKSNYIDVENRVFQNTSNSAMSMFRQFDEKEEKPPYEIDINIEYKYSKNMQNLLDKYGNLWKEIANEQ